MTNPKMGNAESKTRNGKQTKHGQGTNQNRRQLEEIFRLAIIQVKVWFVLSVIAAVLVFCFGMVTTATVAANFQHAPVDFNPISLIVTIITGLIDTVFFVQLWNANKRVDTIRDILFGGK